MPTTTKEGVSAQPALAPDEPDPSLSRDAQFSSYSEVTPPSDITPPPGVMTEQKLGKPTEAT